MFRRDDGIGDGTGGTKKQFDMQAGTGACGKRGVGPGGKLVRPEA